MGYFIGLLAIVYLALTVVLLVQIENGEKDCTPIFTGKFVVYDCDKPKR